jgi:nitrous oxide reductase
LNKINNQQRKNLCSLIDARTKASVAIIDSSDENLLVLVAERLKNHKDYHSLQNKYDALCIKREKKKALNNAKIKCLRDELDAMDEEKDAVGDKIQEIGIVASSKGVLHDKRYVGRSYKDTTFEVQVLGNVKIAWDDVKAGLDDEKVVILESAVAMKEKIWLAETREEAETLIKE